MKKTPTVIYCLILFCCGCTFCIAQDAIGQASTENQKNSIQHTLFFEFFGNAGGLFSINYDCLSSLAEKHKFAVAAGVGYPFYNPDICLALQVNYLYGKNPRHLEIGTGLTFPEWIWTIPKKYSFYNKVEWGMSSSFFIPVRVGYRYQGSDIDGFFWKITFIAFFAQGKYDFWGMSFIPFGGVSIGYTFKNKKH
jgi:hypothetical protein